MKKIIGICAVFLTLNCGNLLACSGISLPTTDPSFCASFKQAAECNCRNLGLPALFCSDPKRVYKLMVSTYGNLQTACAHQDITSVQECVDDWNCFTKGGRNSAGALCSSTGRACA